MVYIALCALILGIIFGQFVLDSTWHDLCSELADYVLYLLMFSVRNSLCYSFYFFVQHLLKLNITRDIAILFYIAKFKYNDC